MRYEHALYALYAAAIAEAYIITMLLPTITVFHHLDLKTQARRARLCVKKL